MLVQRIQPQNLLSKMHNEFEADKALTDLLNSAACCHAEADLKQRDRAVDAEAQLRAKAVAVMHETTRRLTHAYAQLQREQEVRGGLESALNEIKHLMLAQRHRDDTLQSPASQGAAWPSAHHTAVHHSMLTYESDESLIEDSDEEEEESEGSVPGFRAPDSLIDPTDDEPEEH